MFDRVFICPQCGKSDGLQMLPGRCDIDQCGPPLSLLCGKCDSHLATIWLSWELGHRFLRTSAKPVRIHGATVHPSRWRPLPFFENLGKSRNLAVRKMVSECWDDAVIQMDNDYREGLKPPHCVAMIDYLLESLDAHAYVTVRDFLSHCHFRGYHDCFG